MCSSSAREAGGRDTPNQYNTREVVCPLLQLKPAGIGLVVG